MHAEDSVGCQEWVSSFFANCLKFLCELRYKLVDEHLLQFELHFQLLHCVIYHFLFVISQGLLQHVRQPRLSDQIRLLIVNVNCLGVLSIK